MSISACSNQTVGKESSIQSSAVEATSQSKISLDAGDLIGYQTNGVHTFKGIPYAKTERFANPEPIQEFENSPQMALTYGSVAPTHICAIHAMPRPSETACRLIIIDEKR
ncbi:carboxylesterase family protein [Haemophilus pittmaniae]|uniref:carboxylesterase family protein n=1 Tax=Haemophilus pittmaniae TaxID=249188 RepID=UPI0015F03896|nr:carboxylesterase family protein [Haemophilus pittmaniae]